MKHGLYILIFLLFSCTKSNENRIIGAWESVNENVYSGFEFYKNGTVDNKLGFYQYLITDNTSRPYSYFVEKNNISYNRISNYKGSITDYNIVGDTLSIFNLEDRRWDVFNLSFDRDTLIINDKSENRYKYVRLKEKDVMKQPLFDQIILYKPSAHLLPDPALQKLLVSINGMGEMFVFQTPSYYPIFIYQLSPDAIRRINKMLQNADFENYYDAQKEREKSYGDNAYIEMSVVKDNKIHTLQSSIYEGSKELMYLYISTLFLHQCIAKDSEISKETVFNTRYSDTFFFHFKNLIHKNRYLYLTPTQGYYLWLLLAKAKPVNVNFSEKYLLDRSTDNIIIPDSDYIYTDGRYYKSKGQVLDIGFNYLEENDLLNSFGEWKKYLSSGDFVAPNFTRSNHD